MPSLHRAPPSRQLLLALRRPQLPGLTCPRAHALARLRHRNASTTTSRPASSDKPVVLEQPDKFRPPSHGKRLPKYTTPRQYPGPALSSSEITAQKTKRYPHTFPNEGTAMHRFLTSRWIHMWITVGTLLFLATITFTQSFLKTTPFAHLLPPISSFPTHPLRFIREYRDVFLMTQEYVTEETDRKRHEGVRDAQYRRLYRRAHGMEDLDAEEESGIDVRGLVPWDDGLTNKERANGGRKAAGVGIMNGWGQQVENGEVVQAGTAAAAVGGGDQQPVEEVVEMKETPRRKVKRWLGIWE